MTVHFFKICILLRWWLPGSQDFEVIANEAICYATKIHLLHHVITVYAIIKMAVTCANLVKEEIRYHFVKNIKEDTH